MNTYKVNLRATRWLTQTVTVDAADEDAAARIALARAESAAFVWDESDPECVEYEGIDDMQPATLDVTQAPGIDLDADTLRGWQSFWAGKALKDSPDAHGWHLGWARAYALGWATWADIDDVDNPYPQFSGPWEAWAQGWDERGEHENQKLAPAAS
jgi:hypothetical protein